MSLDRVNVKPFQSEVNISNELFEMALTWIFENKCSVNQIINYLVCIEKKNIYCHHLNSWLYSVQSRIR
jgi:hypothetical protein